MRAGVCRAGQEVRGSEPRREVGGSWKGRGWCWADDRDWDRPLPAPPACGKPQRLSRVVGGEDSADAEWPWVVSIQRNRTHHCAGSLLTSRWAVTAAHCFKG